MKKYEIENRYFLHALPPDLEACAKAHITHYYLNPFFDTEILALIRELGIKFAHGFSYADLRALVRATPNKGFRLTRRDDEFLLAFKGRSDKNYIGKKRIEIESTATSSALIAEIIFPRFARGAKQISKTRYFMPLARGLTAELDFFSAPFAHLRLAEVEFSSEKEGRNFVPPDFFGAHATQISSRKLAHQII